MSSNGSDTDVGADGVGELAATVEAQFDRGREAMAAVSDYDQGAVDDLARAVAWAVVEEERCDELTALYSQT